MTPGLAGFLVSGRDEATWEQSVADVLAALAAEFEVVPERGGEPVGASLEQYDQISNLGAGQSDIVTQQVQGCA